MMILWTKTRFAGAWTHVAYDDPTAINAGDAMLALGFEMLADSSHIQDSQLRYVVSAIGQMVRHVAEGQQEDFEFEDRDLFPKKNIFP